MAINKYGVVVLRKSKLIFDYKAKISYKKIEYINDFKEIQHSSIREAINFLGIDFPLDLSYTADIPSRSGLGSSSTFLVSLLHGLYTLINENISPITLANDANYIERDVLSEAGGHQDPIWAAFGGLNTIHFSNDQFTVNTLAFPAYFESFFEESLCLIYTGQLRNGTGSDITKTYTNDFKHQLRILDIATESISYFNHGNLHRIGRLLNVSWAEKKNISASITNKEIDAIIEYGLKHKALGAKLLGAGGGGFIIFIVDPKDRSYFINEMLTIPGVREIPFRIDWKGSRLVHKIEGANE